MTLGILTLFLSLATNPASAAPPTYDVERTEGATVILKRSDGASVRPLNTGLVDLKVHGFLRASESTVLVATGRPCEKCLQDKGVYLFRLEGGKPDQLVFPGRIIEPKTRQVVLDSRMFFGRCLPDEGEVLVVFQKERVDKKHGLQSSVLLVTPGKDHNVEKLLEKRLPKIQLTQQRVRQKNCFEIDGRNRYILNKPLDLTPRHGNTDEDDNDDDGDEDTKEAAEATAAE